MLDDIFGKCGHIFKTYTRQLFLPYLQYVATLPCEIRKSKNVTDFCQVCGRRIAQI